MTKSGKTAILASLFLGATLVGGISAGAAPLSNMPTSIQSDGITKNTEVKKVEFLLGLGIGALVGGLFVHETDRYYNHSHYGHGYRGYGYHSGKYAPWSRAWKKDCSRRYRSFNPRTGNFTSYSGRKVFCR